MILRDCISLFHLNSERSNKLKNLIKILREEAINHGIHAYSLEKGSTKKTNKAADVINKTYKSIKEMGRLDELKPLLDDESPHVRLWVAGFLLDIYPEEAERVLIELGKMRHIGFEARMTLSEWKEGNLKF